MSWQYAMRYGQWGLPAGVHLVLGSWLLCLALLLSRSLETVW